MNPLFIENYTTNSDLLVVNVIKYYSVFHYKVSFSIQFFRDLSNWISSNFSDFSAQSSKHLCSKVPFLSYKISIFTFMKIVCEGRYIDTLYFLREPEEEKISLIVSWLSLFYSPQLEMGPIYHATPFWFSLLPLGP